MARHRLFASMMASDYAHLADEVAALVAGGIDGLHFDVMDGYFVPNITFGADLIRTLRPLTDLPFDVHLMVAEPDVIAPQVIEAGANRVSIHPEARCHLQRSLARIRELGAQPGVAVGPAIPPEMAAWVLDDLDYLLVLSVNPGYSGQEFVGSSRRKLEAFTKLVASAGHEIRIMVDGAVEPANIAELARLGADDFVSGAALFDHRPLEARIRQFREALR